MTSTTSTLASSPLPPDVEEHLEFDGLEIAFDSRVLRPRPWTAAQSSWAAMLMGSAPAGPVLELCSGAGHIGLASIKDNDRRLVSVDLDPVAAAYCLRNARAANLGDRVEVRRGRLESAVRDGEEYAVVIADPPWVRHGETRRFPDDPVLAIDGGEDGLDLARSCLAVMEASLMTGGSGVIQLGSADQAAALATIAAKVGRLAHVATRGYGSRGVLARFDRS